MIAADDRRIPGWRILREYLCAKGGHPYIRISSVCRELLTCLPALLCDPDRPEDASGRPHRITHAPEALRYAVMSRYQPISRRDEGIANNSFFSDFFKKPNNNKLFFD